MSFVRGLVRRNTAQFVGVAAGVALAVALFASVGAFISHAKSTMTRQALAGTTLDWQVEAQPGVNPNEILRAIAHAPGVTAALPVGYAHVPSLTATTGGSTQTTGAGVVLGLPPNYGATFPDIMRRLAGRDSGVLLAQQTAANLHAAPGDTVRIARNGASPIAVRVDGIIDLPHADSLFQKVGAPPTAQPTAPPDNVLFMPLQTWHASFDGMARARPDLVTTQVHARRDRSLPRDPAAAYAREVTTANNMELRLAGKARIGDNIAATLSSARKDALYAEVLFLFLALPGVVCAGLLTATVAGATRDRRRRDQALLRTRGATLTQLVRFAMFEAVAVAGLGGVLGLGLAALVGRTTFGTASFGATTGTAITFAVAALLVGVVIAALSIAWPAARDARLLTVARARQTVTGARVPVWAHFGIDIALLIAGGVVFWLASRSGYQLVLAPEGVPNISVSYWTLLGPALVWLGGGLLAWRIADLVLRRGRPTVERLASPVAGPLSGTVGATLQRQRRAIARGIVLVALSIAFAASTAVFNSTYRQQGRVDALLTNGADVTVTVPTGVDQPGLGAKLAALPSVRHVEAVQHRLTYVGADLQDMYGVNPKTVVAATQLQNGYFTGGSANALMSRLAKQRDAILVSAETVHDFQLQPGDRINLRLQDATTKAYVAVPFHYVGVVKEFPTAPKDSFFIANQTYIAAVTHDHSVGAYLVDTGGAHRVAVAQRARALVGPLATVTDLTHTRHVIASSLTAVDLQGLTKIELAFALALAASSTGLALWLGFAERRRMFAIATAIGARRRQVGAFVWAESAFVAIFGLVAGTVGAVVLANMLVKVLTGVFDPPPSALAIPWLYLGTALFLALAATVVAALAAIRQAAGAKVEVLREL